MENLAVGVLRKAYEDFTPETPIDKMLCALVKEQVGSYIYYRGDILGQIYYRTER
jgi:hypothetical protein